jgi:hypothetical protein
VSTHVGVSHCVLLEHLLRALQRDEFELQQEATLCLEQASLSHSLTHAMLTSPAYTPELLPLGRVFERLLRVPGSCEVPISVIRTVGALTAAAALLVPSPARQVELANLWVDAGITEALDDIQVRYLSAIYAPFALVVTKVSVLKEEANLDQRWQLHGGTYADNIFCAWTG